MRRLFALISGLCFMVGAMAMVLAGVVAWLYIFVTVTQSTGWIGGAVFLVASIWGWARYEDYLKTPWNLWVALWSWADRKLIDRL